MTTLEQSTKESMIPSVCEESSSSLDAAPGFGSKLLLKGGSFDTATGFGLDFMLLLLSIIQFEKDTRGKKM